MGLGQTQKFEFKVKSICTKLKKWWLIQIEAKMMHVGKEMATRIHKTHHDSNLEESTFSFLYHILWSDLVTNYKIIN
jgi:hypothetical protein